MLKKSESNIRPRSRNRSPIDSVIATINTLPAPVRIGIKTLGVATAVAILSGCGPEQTAPPVNNSAEGPQPLFIPTPDGSGTFPIDSNVPPEIAFLSILTRYRPEQLAALTDPNKRDIFSLIIAANAKNTGGVTSYNPETTIGILDCSDSRVCMPPTFTNVTNINDVKYMDLTQEVSGQTLSISRIGAQPALFPVDITQSFFIPHQTAECVTGGCGALGGVEALVSNENGVNQLLHHGVSPMTIEDVKKLISMGAGTTADEALTIEKAWAQTGAKMQAEINHAQYVALNPGAADRTYYSAYGVFGHADNSFQALGVVDNLGNIHSIDEFPLLKSFAGYINTPHPIIESLTSQAPDIIAINGSRMHDTNKLFGELSQEPGILFKSSVNMTPGVPMSVEEARSVVAGADYSVGALKNSKFIVLVADNASDMAVLRTTLMTEGVQSGSMQAFFEQGGVVVEMYPDATGRFTGLAQIRTAEDLSTDFAKLGTLSRSNIASTVNIENSFLGQLEKNALRDLELGVINESQFIKIQNMLRSVRPFAPFFKYGLQMVGDYFAIRDLATWVDEGIMGHNLIWDNPPDRTVWNPNNPIILTADQSRIMSENNGANPYLIEGRLDHINVNQDDLVRAYIGAFNAWFERGPGMPNAAEPWKNMQASDVGKLLTLEVLPPYGPADGQPLKLMTTLVLKPNDEKFDGTNITFDTNNPNQMMMLVDQLTGIPILGDIPNQKTTVAAIDPTNPNIRYLFEVTSVPSERRFQFNFIGVVPVDSAQSSLPNSADNKPHAQINELTVSIPVGADDIFGHKTEDAKL